MPEPGPEPEPEMGVQLTSAAARWAWYVCSGCAAVGDSAASGTAVPFILSVRLIGAWTAAVVTSIRSLLYDRPGRKGLGMAYAAAPGAGAGAGGPGGAPGGQNVVLLTQLSRV